MSVTIPENIGKGLSKMPELEETLQALADAIDAVTGSTLVTGKVRLNGLAYTPVSFVSNIPAILTSTVHPATYDLSSLLTGTFIVNPDADGAQTITLAFTKGTSQSAGTPSTDISAGIDSKFKISVDGDVAETVTLDLTAAGGLDSGAKIATEMQTKIQALGVNKAAVTVSYNAGSSGKYLVTSGTYGHDSRVVITAATTGNITEELKIGAIDLGTETVGTGMAGNPAVATADEFVTWINANTTKLTVSNVGGYITLTSDTAGRTSSIVMGNSTLKTVLGFADTAAAYGAQGLGKANMADANYLVTATLDGATSLASLNLSITNKTTNGFNIRCETTASTEYVALHVNE